MKWLPPVAAMLFVTAIVFGVAVGRGTLGRAGRSS